MLGRLGQTIKSFIASETSSVHQARLPAAWTAGAIVAMALYLGAPDAVEPNTCPLSSMIRCDDPSCIAACEGYGCYYGVCDGIDCVCADCLPPISMAPCDSRMCDLVCSQEWNSLGGWCVLGYNLCVCIGVMR